VPGRWNAPVCHHQEGAFAKLSPGIEELQKKLGIVEKLDAIQQNQQQEEVRADARHAPSRLSIRSATVFVH
jgi:hypothetical protein